jgi:U3 small nucleolar RNA-associated protein 4
MSIIATPAVPPSATRFTTATNPLRTGTVGTAPTFEESTQRRIAYSAPGAIQVARQARLVMKMQERSLVFWRVHPKPGPSADDEYGVTKQTDNADSWEKVLEMQLAPQANFQTGAISNDGKWVFVADAYESKLFTLEEVKIDFQGSIQAVFLTDLII